MINFGREAGRRGAPAISHGVAFADRLAADPSLMQLLPLMALRAESGAIGFATHRSGQGRIDEARAFMRHAVILREIARRTGEVETLGRAASAVLRARDLAQGDKRLAGEALLQHAETLMVAASLFGDAEAATAAALRLDEAETFPLDGLAKARSAVLRARLLAREALGARSPLAWRSADAALAATNKSLQGFVGVGRLDASEVAEVRCDRAELLIGIGLAGKDRGKIEQADADLNALLPTLNPAYRPLTWARAETLRGQALAALGDMVGDAACIAEGSNVLTAVVEEILAAYSPLDAARAGHGLGLVLQSLGEACEEEALFDRAVAAFAPALEALDSAPMLPFRSIVAHDSAACLARRAERRGDLQSLQRAEAAFRETLKTSSAAADPLAWAVTQVALARIYEAEADLRGDMGERADAAFALASALDVFAERGLRSLADVALTALERVRATA